MRASLYIGATGMKSLSEGMHVTTNNLANCSTIGFKSQMALYSDLIYKEQANPGEWNNNQVGSHVAVGQNGMGVRVEEIATNFTQGGFESTNSLTDLAINGKGYFMVQNESGDYYYTRAGDFNVDTKGVMRNPNGLALMGYNLAPDLEEVKSEEQESEKTIDIPKSNSASTGIPEAISIDRFKHIAAKATSSIGITDTNLVPDSNVATNIDNPYFSMLTNYNATQGKPLPSESFSNEQELTLYDQEGNAHDVTIYYDATPQTGASNTIEFLVAENLEAAENAGDGVLMSGVLSFDLRGQLTGLAAYTPETPGSLELSNFIESQLSEEGLPVFSLGESQVALDFGLHGESSSQTEPRRASDVGTNAQNLSFLQNVETSDLAVTAYSSTPFSSSSTQDGYAEGVLSSYEISTDGVISGNFSNGENIELWQIPLARFTSDDGLHRHGDNLFAATSEAGTMVLGVPGTENYGTVVSSYIETSNVDMAREMVNMIVTQRGFQSNSKVVTTSDELLRTAINLKR